MSAYAHWLVYCDDPECMRSGTEAHDGDASVSLNGIRLKRQVLKREGWTHVQGQDYCPDCSKRREKKRS